MFSVVDLAGAEQGPVQTPVQTIETAVPRNTGRATDGAFLVDFARGYVRGAQVLADWDIRRDWLNVSYRKANIGFDGQLMMLKAIKGATSAADYTGAEFQNDGFYGYGRYEAVMRAAGETGAVSAFFSYAGQDVGDPHDEIDFEILGKSPGRAHTNFFVAGEDAPADVDLWFDASAAEHLYAYEWSPGGIAWFIDGVKVREVKVGDPGVRIPTTTGRVMASIWAAQGQSALWAGKPAFAAAQATLRCISHVPLGRRGPQCSDTFKTPKP